MSAEPRYADLRCTYFILKQLRVLEDVFIKTKCPDWISLKELHFNESIVKVWLKICFIKERKYQQKAQQWLSPEAPNRTVPMEEEALVPKVL